MIVIDWKDKLALTGQIEASERDLNINILRMKNVTSTNYEALEYERLLFVLEGECDLVWTPGRYRLNAGSWIVIPAGCTFILEVFRSVGPCSIAMAQSKGRTHCFASCNAFDMVPMDGRVWFGQECEKMTAMLTESADDVPVEAIMMSLGESDMRQLCFVPQKIGEGYQDWLFKTYGILWSNGVRKV